MQRPVRLRLRPPPTRAMEPASFASEDDFQKLISRFSELLVGDQIDPPARTPSSRTRISCIYSDTRNGGSTLTVVGRHKSSALRLIQHAIRHRILESSQPLARECLGRSRQHCWRRRARKGLTMRSVRLVDREISKARKALILPIQAARPREEDLSIVTIGNARH